MPLCQTPTRDTNPTVFGLISDRGWILERLAQAIAAECPEFRYGTEIEGQPDIVYYITYSARKKPYNGLEIGYFSHIEEGLPAESQFFKVAGEVQACVTQATRYETALRAKGATDVTTIPPGIDHTHLKPRLQVGVVGRTYHTGRKGEAMMARLMDMVDVEFHFTGDGWPGPPHHVPHGKMQEFYRAMDYVLVPALYEGGPMCVPEALACGIPVIAPTDVGWVEDFPHIPYPKGDTEALRALLQTLAQPKLDLAKSAEQHTWSRWGQAHGALFRRVYDKYGGTQPSAPRSPLRRAEIIQVLHGGERNSKGGPSIRVPQTALRLEALCQRSELQFGHPAGTRPADIAHLYNVWQPNTALATAQALKRHSRHLVYSPILLDLSLRAFWEVALQDTLKAIPPSPDRFASALPQLQRRYAQAKGDRDLALRGYQPVPGFAGRLRSCLELADHCVFLSEFERSLAETITGYQPKATSVLRNPVDTAFFQPGRAAQSDIATRLNQVHGLAPGSPFLLSVGRIEARKNQVMMAEIAKRVGVPVVLVGHIGSQVYANSVLETGNGFAHLFDRVEPHSQELLWLYQNCAAFLSFSWAEGASLSALEAAASGASMVLTETSSEREYFDAFARFTGPLDIETATEQVKAALAPREAALRQDQHDQISARFGWDSHIKTLASIYGALL